MFLVPFIVSSFILYYYSSDSRHMVMLYNTFVISSSQPQQRTAAKAFSTSNGVTETISGHGVIDGIEMWFFALIDLVIGG